MSLSLVVLAKQVPDWSNVTGEAMNADGTVNRGALPAVFNPDDLYALELALDLKDRVGAHVSVLTMGPPRASDILRDALYRGADRVIYAGYYPMGLSLERIMGDMAAVPFRDHVWPKFLHENARRVLKLEGA